MGHATVLGSVPMASNPKTAVRLPPILLAYLDDLAKLGAYGKGRSGVMRRFIEDGIQEALKHQVVAPKDVAEFGEEGGEEAADD